MRGKFKVRAISKFMSQNLRNTCDLCPPPTNIYTNTTNYSRSYKPYKPNMVIPRIYALMVTSIPIFVTGTVQKPPPLMLNSKNSANLTYLSYTALTKTNPLIISTVIPINLKPCIIPYAPPTYKLILPIGTPTINWKQIGYPATAVLPTLSISAS